MFLMDMWRKYRKTVVAMSVAGAVLAAGCGGALADNTTSGTMPATSRPAASGTLSDARNTPAVRVAKSVGPAVVGITNRAVARDWFNHQFEYEQGVGSGVIFRSDGYIVTNYHVVAGAREIMVSLSDGRSVKGKMVGADELTDIAVVKIDGDGFPTAAFGNSDDIVVGEPAIAIGNPMGLEFQGSVTVGVISALNRTLDISERHLKLIQTDAAISPGNSGGALANADGLVIGINSAKIAANGVEGMGFAIPINSVRDIVDQLLDHGRVIRPYLGVGVYVQNVTLDGPAGKAGLQRGDVILSVGGEKTDTVGELRAAITGHQVGDTVEIVLMRGNDKITVNAVLEAIPEQ